MNMSHHTASIRAKLRGHRRDRLRIHRAQAVECDPQNRVPVRRIAPCELAPILEELIGGTHEARLSQRRRDAAEIAVLIQGRQQREPDAGARRGPGNGRVRVEHRFRAAREPVQIQKFRHASVAAAQQIQITARRDRLQILIADLPRRGVHRLAPGPEVFRRGPCPLCPGGQQPLEGMAMRIGQAGQREPGHIGGRAARGGLLRPRLLRDRRTGHGARDPARTVDLDRDIGAPGAVDPKIGKGD